ncbi:unnamed protein product [Euphydryas editha]|uniref:Retrotransposon gag domain-containing protein n=1 Tax=Euphydryas editha TaxID=104508 RepID=A0AAU9U816_EUPED|nr:unnamed protein product [Euphydryas editha]
MLNKVNMIGKSSNPSTSSEPTASLQTTSEFSHLSGLQKIKFNGKTCVHEFLQRVREYSSVRNIPSSKILTFATELFTGDALHWYRSIGSSVNSWDELVTLLKEDFSHFDHDYRLMSEIRNRTQGDSENITIYLAKMSELFSRLTKTISEQEKLDILLHNIRPCYSGVLASNSSSITTIDNLRTLCRNFEKIKCLTSQFKEPPRISSVTLAPDLAYSKSSDYNFNKANYYLNNKYNNNSKNYNYNKFNYKNQGNNSSFNIKHKEVPAVSAGLQNKTHLWMQFSKPIS